MTATTDPDASPVVSFGPTEVPDYRRIPIDFRYFRDESVTTERFNVMSKTMDIGAANRVMRLIDAGGEQSEARAIMAMINLIGKFMDDKDGTPATWEPVALPKKKGDDENAPVRFRDPKGRIQPWDKHPDYLEVKAGSSRRRWLYLMNEDDEASVDKDALIELLQFLMELAGKDHGHA